MALTTHPHLAPRLKKEYVGTSTSPLGFRGLFYGELYFTFTYINYLSRAHFPIIFTYKYLIFILTENHF